MPKRIIFATNKGGVGKTSTTAICAEILAAAGYKVLVVDLDSQGNLTRILTGKSKYKFRGRTIMEAVEEGNAEPYIEPLKDGLDLIPAEDRLAMFSRYIYASKVENPYATIKRLLATIDNRYDYVFIDVSPSLGDTVINAIVYADKVIIPVDSGDLGMDALIGFQEFVETTNEEGHTNAEVLGILLTMRDRRSKYEKDIADGLREAFGNLVFKTEIGRKVKIKEMPATGININHSSVSEYVSLVEEILVRTGGKIDE